MGGNHQKLKENDVENSVRTLRNAIQQDNEKMKVQYLRSCMFDLFEVLQVVRT